MGPGPARATAGVASRGVRTHDLAPWPVSIPAYYVLDADGKLLHAQPAIELRTKDAYDPKKLEQFLRVWSQVTKEL